MTETIKFDEEGVIERMRKERGWSQAELARRAGINAGTISIIEAKRFAPYQSQIDAIFAAFNEEPAL